MRRAIWVKLGCWKGVGQTLDAPSGHYALVIALEEWLRSLGYDVEVSTDHKPRSNNGPVGG